jgi:hypothetical protein
VPIAVLAAAAWVYPRLRAGHRAVVAMTFGALAIAVGVPGAYYLADGSATGDHYSGLLVLAAGAVLLDRVHDPLGHVLVLAEGA